LDSKQVPLKLQKGSTANKRNAGGNSSRSAIKKRPTSEYKKRIPAFYPNPQQIRETHRLAKRGKFTHYYKKRGADGCPDPHNRRSTGVKEREERAASVGRRKVRIASSFGG